LTLKNYFLPINVAVAYADYIIFAIPSAFLSDELAKLTVSLQDKIIFSAKGIPETSLIVGEHFHFNTIFPITI
jgi:glycerol-3-phosphate dehydrogenase (NAD(P)+)